MKKINESNKLSFDIKRKVMMSINNSIIAEAINEEDINNFDGIFTSLSTDEIDCDVFLYGLWLEIKKSVRKHHNNKEKLYELLEYINTVLDSVVYDNELDNALVKIKGGSNERKYDSRYKKN